jgi:hypothetical protein
MEESSVMIRHRGNCIRSSMVWMKQWWHPPRQEDMYVMHMPLSENPQGMSYAGDGAEALEGVTESFWVALLTEFSRKKKEGTWGTISQAPSLFLMSDNFFCRTLIGHDTSQKWPF